MEGNSFTRRYEIIKCLGKGATAEVYLVEETATHNRYAMKIGERGKGLQQEASWMEVLVDTLFPSFKEFYAGEQEYLVMEYIEGKSLQALLDEGHRFETRWICHIMEGVLRGLEQLHNHTPGIVYRDLKPENIMIETSGRIRLLDLGTIMLEGEKGQRLAGTYGYAAPEQFWRGISVTKACDIYAAGKVLAYLLTGRNPAEPPYDMEVDCKSMQGLHPAYRKLLERSLAYDAQGRYEDCERFRVGLKEAFDEEKKRKLFIFHKKTVSIYKKCIWKSEYRRIF